jgi:hypothetical protein
MPALEMVDKDTALLPLLLLLLLLLLLEALETDPPSCDFRLPFPFFELFFLFEFLDPLMTEDDDDDDDGEEEEEEEEDNEASGGGGSSLSSKLLMVQGTGSTLSKPIA